MQLETHLFWGKGNINYCNQMSYNTGSEAMEIAIKKTLLLHWSMSTTINKHTYNRIRTYNNFCISCIVGKNRKIYRRGI